MKTILLVEDDPALRQLMNFSLSQTYNVVAVEDGSGALAVLEGYGGQLDLLLTDAGLPHMSGWELSERAQKLRPAIECLVVSGGEDQHPSSVREVNYSFIQKPYSLSELGDAVRQALVSSLPKADCQSVKSKFRSAANY